MQRWDGEDDLERLADLLRAGDLCEAMMEADVREAMRELDLPHVVACFDPTTGYLTVEGPYDNGISASQMADQDVAADRLGGSGLSYMILPLLPRRDHPQA